VVLTDIITVIRTKSTSLQSIQPIWSLTTKAKKQVYYFKAFVICIMCMYSGLEATYYQINQSINFRAQIRTFLTFSSVSKKTLFQCHKCSICFH